MTLICGCGYGRQDRAARLVALAAGEAAEITKPRDRLQQQLNIAEMQIRRAWMPDARTNLVAARKTIESADRDQLTDLDRIAGWVSISELSRDAGDYSGATVACDSARKSLTTIQPESKRCEYVRGLSREFFAIGDGRSAVDLLTQAGAWAKGIEQEAYRRQALVALANDLFNWDAFDNGRTVLRNDSDAAWRSQTLLTLAAVEETRNRNHTPGLHADAVPGAASSFGLKVDYKSNYQQKR